MEIFMNDIQTFALGQSDHGYVAEELLIPENCGMFSKNGDFYHIVIENEMARVYKSNDEDFHEFIFVEEIEFA